MLDDIVAHPIVVYLRSVHVWVWLTVSGLSVLASLVGIGLIPVLVCRLSSDWFVKNADTFYDALRANPLNVCIRNFVGIILIGFGVLLLFLPGQGVLTILLGLMVTDLPVRSFVIRYVARRKPVALRFQMWRKTRGYPPFEGLTQDSDIASTPTNR